MLDNERANYEKSVEEETIAIEAEQHAAAGSYHRLVRAPFLR